MKTILRIAMGTIMVGGLVFSSGCAIMDDDSDDSTDIKISMTELPSAIKSLAEKEIDGCKVKEVEKEMKDGKTIYAITYYEEDGTLMELEYAENGKLLSKAKE
jgi:uncharacterized membrane protein YkoI